MQHGLARGLGLDPGLLGDAVGYGVAFRKFFGPLRHRFKQLQTGLGGVDGGHVFGAGAGHVQFCFFQRGIHPGDQLTGGDGIAAFDLHAADDAGDGAGQVDDVIGADDARHRGQVSQSRHGQGEA